MPVEVIESWEISAETSGGQPLRANGARGSPIIFVRVGTLSTRLTVEAWLQFVGAIEVYRQAREPGPAPHLPENR